MVKLEQKIVHSDQYDIDINCYLTYAQIQQIVNAIETNSQENDSWSDRQTNIDMLVLFHATNIGKEKLEKFGHEKLLSSGLIDEVNSKIMNLYQIYEAIDFTESISRAGFKFISQLPKVLDNNALKAILQKHDK